MKSRTLKSMSAPRAAARGFTLIEVMVALIVTSIGLLGIAKMQALAYASTGTASMRSLVAIEASGLAAAMRANRGYWGGTGPGIWTANKLSITDVSGVMTIDDATLNGAATNASDCMSGGASAPCAAATLAAYDLHTWANALGLLLPNSNPNAVISCPTTSTPINCTITVNWTEKTVAVNKQSVAVPAITSYSLSVEP